MTKSMKTVVIIIITFAILTSAIMAVCYATGAFDKNNHDTWFEDARNGGIDEDKTKEIQLGMTFGEIVEIIGKPQRDTGSGVWQMEWDLKSGRVFVVCFNPAVSDNDGTMSITNQPNFDLISYYIETRDK